MSKLTEQLRPASFRGIAFQMRDATLTGGRRVQLHEYPQRDKPYAQDMGRASRLIRLQAFVIGLDYISQATVLLDAIETKGPGELIHPWLGKMNVTALDVGEVHFDPGLGVAEIELSFVESGELVFPLQSIATVAATQSAASALMSAATGFFAQVFRVAAFVNLVAVRALMVYGTVQSLIANPLNFALQALGLRTVAGNLQSLYAAFSNPVTVGQTFARSVNLAGAAANYPQTDKFLGAGVAGLLNAASHPALADPLGISAMGRPSASVPALPLNAATGSTTLALLYVSQTVAYGNAPAATGPFNWLPFPVFLETNPVLTPSQQQQYANAVAINAHVRLCLLVQAVGLSSLMPCTVYDDVLAVRDRLCAALDAEILAVASLTGVINMARAALLAIGQKLGASPNQSIEALVNALTDARAAVHADLTARARNSARLLTLPVAIPTPALVLAYDRYEDAEREAEIISRNKIRRPGFIPVGTVRLLNA